MRLLAGLPVTALSFALSVPTLDAQAWVRVDTPNFSLLTDADPRTGRNVALEFELARAVLREATGAEVDAALPIIIFAVRDRGELRVLLPGLQTSGEIPLGVFLSSPDRHRIAVRLDEPSDHRFQAVYHEYHHLLFRSNARFRYAPVWLVEGLAEFWSSMERARGGEDSLTIGRPNPRHIRVLKLRGMLPLVRLLRYGGKVHEEPPERIAVIYAQSWALVHHLMLEASAASSANGRVRFERYLERYLEGDADGNDPIAAFETVFGPVASIEAALARHLDQTMFPVLTMAAPEPPEASKFRFTEIDEARAEAEIGMFVATGPWPEHAPAHLERALLADPSSTSAMEGMGFVSFRRGELDAAEAWFTKAASADETSYLAHYYTGVLVASRAGPSDAIVSSLERAIALNPRFAPAYVALSGHLSEDPARREEALTLARDATRLAPEAALVWTNLASILERLGRPEEARRAMERARARARGGSTP